MIPQAIRLYEPDGLAALAEDYAAALVETGEHRRAIRLIGAADATRTHHATPRNPQQQAEIAQPFTEARAALSPEDYDREYQAGLNMTVENALIQLINPPGVR